MKIVFADTLFWIARINPRDPWANSAKQAEEKLGETRIVTTDEVLADFLAALSKYGEKLRILAAKMVREILNNPNVKVSPQSRNSFLKGLDLYEDRPDKEYSLTDCVSMNTTKAERLNEILTNDHHFEQEGFTLLMK